MGRPGLPNRRIQTACQTLHAEASLCIQHHEILLGWQQQFSSAIFHVLKQTDHATQADVETLNTIRQWAQQERQRQLEGLAELCKVLYGEEAPKELVSLPQTLSPARQILVSLQQLLQDFLARLDAPHNEAVQETEEVPGFETHSEEFEKQTLTDDFKVYLVFYLGISSLSCPNSMFFDFLSHVLKLRKWQLQREMAAMLQRPRVTAKASGLQLLQELEQAPERSERFQEAQAQLRRELQSSQQQNKEEFLLQQLELEMELERELKKKVPSVSVREQELQLKVQQMLESLAHMTWNVSVTDEEQRMVLWTYLQAELVRPTEEPRKGRGKGPRPGAGPLLRRPSTEVFKPESKKEMPSRPSRRLPEVLGARSKRARAPKPELKPSLKAPEGAKRGGSQVNARDAGPINAGRTCSARTAADG